MRKTSQLAATERAALDQVAHVARIDALEVTVARSALGFVAGRHVILKHEPVTRDLAADAIAVEGNRALADTEITCTRSGRGTQNQYGENCGSHD